MIQWFRLLRYCAMMALLTMPVLAFSAPGWQGLLAPAGSLRLERGGREFGTLEPGLHELGWRGASLSPARLGDEAGETMRGAIRAPGGGGVATELHTRPVQNGIHLLYRLTPGQDISLNSLHVALAVPVSLLSGGDYAVDGQKATFPAQFKNVGLFSGPVRSLVLALPDQGSLRMTFAEPTPVLVQDDRQWGPTFTVRIGPQMGEAALWPAGKTLQIDLTLTSPEGMKIEYDSPITLTAGKDWLPLDTRLEIAPGSALDFSKLFAWHAPAGRLGRVIGDKKGRLVFEKRPKEAARFYGFNLCFSAQYLSHAQSDRLAARLQRLGYNAVRFHHYESELVDRSQGTSTRLNPQALDQLDYLFAALKKNGIYVTTDLFVSRPVFAREVWEGAEGDIGMDEFKMAVPVNERAFANYKAFSVALLSHRNPYTGLRWGEDPALAWLNLINEGNPGNFIGNLSTPLKEDYARTWNRWLARRFPTLPALTRFLGSIREGEDPARGTVPMPTGDGSPYWLPFNVFLADNQKAFFGRTRAFLRSELNCRALLSNMNAWTNPVQIQAVRQGFDYVDDHFYVDHPEFIERPWQLPSCCSNNIPVAEGAPGGRPSAFLRLMDKPFTESEFNYSGPSRFRGVGGILTGALGALQDWSVIWRFAYSHSRANLFTPSAAGYFDMATDPLNQAADRASICLFRRGDPKAAPHAVAIAMTPKDALEAPKSARGAVPSWHGLALVTRVGSVVTDHPDKASGADFLLPVGWTVPQVAWKGITLDMDPYAPDTGDKVLAEMRRRGWVSRANRTDMRASRFQSETGEMTVDGPADILTLNTARTCGGYAPAGRAIRTRPVTIRIEETDATVWVSSLDNAPIASSRRLLITHLTDLQNTNSRFADKSRKILLDWGGLPHLVRSGKATVALRLDHPERASVWGLETDGQRAEPIPARVQKGALVIPLDIDRGGKARMLYEVAVR